MRACSYGFSHCRSESPLVLMRVRCGSDCVGLPFADVRPRYISTLWCVGIVGLCPVESHPENAGHGRRCHQAS